MAARPPEADRGQRRLSSALAEYRAGPGAADGQRPPVSLVEVMLAVPPGCTRPRTRRQLMRMAAARPELGAYQQRRQDKLLAWLRIHVRWASWFDGSPAGPRATARPGRARVCAEGGFKETTYRFCRQFWEDLGFVATVREGRTKDAREHDRDGQPLKRKITRYDGNDAKVIVLCVPPPEPKRAKPAKPAPAPPAASAPRETRAPQVVSPDLGEPRAREARPGENRDGQGQEGPRFARTLLRAMPRALATHPLLKTLSDKGLARAWADFGSRGYTPSDWLWAIDHRQNNRPYPMQLGTVRRPAAVLDWRLRQWRDEDGVPVLSRSQRAAVRKLEERQAAAAQAALEAADREASRLPPKTPGAHPPGPVLGALREELAELNWKQKGKRS